MKKWRSFVIAILAIAAGCSSLVIDPSPAAVASNDLTLALMACDGPLSSGFGVCRVKEGTDIDSSWHAILPRSGGAIQGGELIVRMRDVQKSYAIPTDGIVIIPMKDFFGERKWEQGDTSIGNATAKIRVTDGQGLETIVQAEGQILIRVLAKDYDPMPIDSGYKAWGTNCKVQYSSVGRGAVSCD